MTAKDKDIESSPPVTIDRVDAEADLPEWLTREALGEFLHESLKPYEDPLPGVLDGVDYALTDDPCRGGFALLAHVDRRLYGALVMLKTGMKGYVPENILLFVAVDPAARGQGIGGRLVRRGVKECEGDVKLHVEHDNPARHLYERCGFSSKYLEMRWSRESNHD